MTHKLYSEIQYTFSHPIKRCGNIELAHCHFLLKQVRWRCCLGAPEDWTLSCLCVWRRNKLWGHFSPHSWLKFSFCHLFFHTYSSFIIPLLFLSFFFFINHPCFLYVHISQWASFFHLVFLNSGLWFTYRWMMSTSSAPCLESLCTRRQWLKARSMTASCRYLFRYWLWGC